MLKDLQWDTLEERRKRNRLSIFYKIHNGQTGIDSRKYLTPLGRKSHYVNGKTYKVPFAQTDYFKFSYFPRTIREWNILPEETVCSISHKMFEGSIYNFSFCLFSINVLLYFYSRTNQICK